MKKILSLILVLLGSIAVQAQILEDLCCDHLTNPIGIDENNPRLSWRIVSAGENISQASYSIIISESLSNIQRGKGDIWQSGRIYSNKNLVIYKGKQLKPKSRYYWNVIVWDNKGQKYLCRETPFFETGKMNEKWQAKWISDSQDTLLQPAPYFRKVFRISKQIKNARIYVSAAGLIDLSMNDNAITEDRLNPMFTRYDRRCLYLTYDVTEKIHHGSNVLGVILGNGWYNFQSRAVWNYENAEWRNRPTFCLELHINYSDGTSEILCSDTSWKTNLGPIVFNSIYTGEHYDARKELSGWERSNYDDTDWHYAIEREAPAKVISSQVMSPIKITKEFRNLICGKINDSIYVYRLPENIAGIAKLKIKGLKGTKVKLKYGETLDKDGRVDQSTINIYSDQRKGLDPFQTDIYILKGEGVEEFMPKFNYKGFQYIEVSADRPVQLDSNSIIAYRMNSDVRMIGNLESSSDLVNKLWAATNRSYLSNLYGYPTDCPQREKNGWTADAHLALDAALYNYDNISVYEKWMDDHRDAQMDNGLLPAIIPTSGWGYTWGNGVDWTSSMIIVPWKIYLYYGDTQILKENYDSMKLYIDHITSISKEYLTDWGLGDWNPYKTVANKELMISIYYYYDALLFSKISKILGKEMNSKLYGELAVKIRSAINEKFLDKENSIYASGSQTELSAPLYYNIVPEKFKQKVADNLAKRVIADNRHLDVGVLGSKTLLEALSENGYTELAYEVATQKTYPSWGWWIENGATTLYESWKIDTKTISKNHIMFGEISSWFFKELGGIKVDEENPGFHSAIIKPHFVKRLNNFKVEYDSTNGKIISSWKRIGDKIEYNLVIPANCKAKVYMGIINQNTEIELNQRSINNGNSLLLGSGKYRFLIRPVIGK